MTSLREGSVKTLMRTLIIILSLTLSACGFHLRGSEALPASLSSIRFECANEKFWDLCRKMRREFQLHEIELNENANMTVRISAVSNNQRSLSINPDASTAEYDLIRSVQYQLIDSASRKQVSSRIIEASQSYRHQSSALIAKEREREEIQAVLNKEITYTLFRQLSVFDAQRINQALSNDAN